ncbi:glycosyltransferase family 2 protein [Fibrella forsythiae]|uniref:Glycosyltransferase n=1 Tax=Fibrella forsythiae TaxID=2817061 RepID=A0ABS3JMR7_9BACT|nr:glycosyltransferase family A protein [Fibrella forsythiae]MBO0951289.1 glycosyltransferase [Fibrella forsythiae]
MNPLVTVVIPTCLRQAKLRACLLALAQQKLSPSQFEIIVVDQADDRATANMVKETANLLGLSVRYVSQRRDRNEAAACNRGWRLANSLFIAFTHDDCLPQPLWLTTALPLFHNGAQVIIGRVQYPLPNHPIVASAGANLFCRRALLEQVGGFDEWLNRKQHHEDNWLDRLARAEIPIISCPDAVVVRPFRGSAWFSTLRIMLSKLL